MNMKTSMSVLLKTITFVACVSLRSTFAYKLRGSVIAEAAQSSDEHAAFPVPGEGEMNAASSILPCWANGWHCNFDKDCCSNNCVYNGKNTAGVCKM